MGKKFYECEQDNSYCYQDSCILKNKLGIRNKEQLEEAERNITALRILQLKTGELRGEPNFKYLCKIHKHIFGDIYSWAGKIRTVDISKGNMFCNSQFILENAEDIFNRLKKENYLQDYKDVNKMSERLAYYLSEINALHPFREGNGRAQREFIIVLARRAGYVVDFSKVSQEEMIQASEKAFYCDYRHMNDIFLRITSKQAGCQWNSLFSR